MAYVANFYKMIILIFATNYRLLQNDPYDYCVEISTPSHYSKNTILQTIKIKKRARKGHSRWQK